MLTTRCFSKLAFMALASLSLVACATADQQPTMAGGVQVHDPFESTNRAVFAFNTAVDDVLIHPAAKGYQAVVPKPARTGVSNFLRHLKSPVVFANQVLQGDADGAGDVFLRATINTFVGLGGIFDVAGHEGIEYESEDFGQTLGVWGIGHGPYLVVPLLGPSSVRDYAGYAVDSFADPLRWYLFNTDREGVYYAKVAADYFDLRQSLVDVLEDLRSSSIDYYASVRSTYYQRREALTNDEMKGALDNEGVATIYNYSIPDFDDDAAYEEL